MTRRLLWLAFVLLLLGCAKQRPEKAPGETDIVVSEVAIEAPPGSELTVDDGELFMLLGLRTGNAIVTHRYFNEFKLAEDRRRIRSFWQTYGFFDVEVSEPKVEFAPDRKSVKVTWTVREGAPYHIESVQLERAPPGHERELWKLIPFEKGDPVDLEEYRHVRLAMAEALQRDGFGHAVVISRAFVDRENKAVHWYYYADPGPKTRVGKIMVEGTKRVPEDKVLERMGYAPGKPYSLALKEDSEIDLLDTGDYASVAVKPTADVERVLPGERPETGGHISAEQVDANGDLVPRKLPEDVDVRVVVVEAPRAQLRLRAGAEADPTRADVYANSRLFLRDLFGPWHHLELEGGAGYGFIYSDDEDERGGVYGHALVRYLRPGLFGRLGDFRLTASYRDTLFPGFLLREIAGGPGVRTTLARGLFWDVDALFHLEHALDFGPFDAATRDRFALPEEDTPRGADLETTLTWDARDDGVEPKSGHLMALRAAFFPGPPLGSARVLRLDPDLRGFLPFGESWSLAARVSGGFAMLNTNDGVPVAERLFGGGAWGMRGFGRQRLSPSAPCAAGASCTDELVGGRSLLEASLEMRFLPFRKPIGLALFTDAGGAGRELNPFDTGVSLAVGLGPRLRLWYLPISLDASYRVLLDDEPQPAGKLSSYLVFLRIGEAF